MYFSPCSSLCATWQLPILVSDGFSSFQFDLKEAENPFNNNNNKRRKKSIVIPSFWKDSCLEKAYSIWVDKLFTNCHGQNFGVSLVLWLRLFRRLHSGALWGCEVKLVDFPSPRFADNGQRFWWWWVSVCKHPAECCQGQTNRRTGSQMMLAALGNICKCMWSVVCMKACLCLFALPLPKWLDVLEQHSIIPDFAVCFSQSVDERCGPDYSSVCVCVCV